jgi:hypothetical protein
VAGRLALALLIVAVAVIVAALLRARRTREPIRTGFHVPTQLDRSEFARPDAPWLIATFTSATCDSCADTWQKVQVLESDDVSVDEIELSDRGDLHERYDIDAVPTVVIADSTGGVRGSFLGPPPAAELWAIVAELREPD